MYLSLSLWLLLLLIRSEQRLVSRQAEQQVALLWRNDDFLMKRWDCVKNVKGLTTSLEVGCCG